MKNLIFVFCVLFCLNIPVFALDFNNKLDVFNNFYEYSNGVYNFKPMNKKSYKSLTEQQKANYESICKANKLWVKGSQYPENSNKRVKLFVKAYKLDNSLFPVARYLGLHYYKIKDYPKAEFYLLQLSSKFDNERDLYLANVYDSAKNYSKTIQYASNFLKQTNIKQESKAKANFLIMSAYFSLEQYKDASKYADILLYSFPKYYSEYKYFIWIVKYMYYNEKKDNKAALGAAKKMLDIEKCYLNYFLVAKLSNSNEKLNLYYNAKKLAKSKDEKIEVMAIIAKLEQAKIDAAVKNLKIYVKKPDWFKIIDNAKYGSIEYWEERQDDFFKTANNCIKTQYGNNLVACFKQLNEDQEKLTIKLNDDVYKAKQLRLQQQSIMQQQQQIYWQQQNYYSNERNRRYMRYGY